MALTVYKKGQGTAARGISAIVVMLVGVWGAHQMWYVTAGWKVGWRWGFTAAAGALFGVLPLCLILFHHRVTEVLIDTQLEMRKVAWSSRSEVIGSTTVVVIVVALMSVFILTSDFAIFQFLDLIGLY